MISTTLRMEAPPLHKKEILRYARCYGEDPATERLMEECLEISKDAFSFRVCYGTVDIELTEEEVLWADGAFLSRALVRHLSGCDRLLMMAATVGLEIDRLVARYGVVSPAHALMLQAIGSERIEALCDAFCQRIAREIPGRHTTRFSPGYADLPLESQALLFSRLKPETRIGLSLTEHYLLSPTKSVTALIGIQREKL